jgi:hypothetical protein
VRISFDANSFGLLNVWALLRLTAVTMAAMV